MKVLVVGSGAVGGYYGGVLSKSGEDVTLVARGEHLDAIRINGLRVESVASGDFTIHPSAVETPDGSWKADLALFCVKSYHNERAIEVMRPAIGDDTAILTLQNGIGSGDELAKAFGADKVLLGATYIDAMRRAPGVVAEVSGDNRIVFGEEDGRQTPRAIDIREAFLQAGVDIRMSSDVRKDLWDKLIMICALSGMMCITRGSLAEVLETPDALDLMWRVLREVEAIGRAKGVGLDDDVVESTMKPFQASKHDVISSMRLDLDAGNRLEVGVLNGAVARMGKEVGVATPVNEFITACLTVADNRARDRKG